MATRGGFKAGKGLQAVVKARGVTGKITVKKIDKGLDRIRNTLRSIQTDKSYVKAGYLGKANKPRKVDVYFSDLKTKQVRKRTIDADTPLTNVQLGIKHEFGEGRVPARPHIRPAFAKNRGVYLILLQRLVAASVYDGKIAYPRALAILGMKMAADMKKYITAGPQIPPPNQGYPDHGYFMEKVERGYWKKRKVEGPPLPPRTLVDTGRMVASITYAVVLRSSGDVRRGDTGEGEHDENFRLFRRYVDSGADKVTGGRKGIRAAKAYSIIRGDT